MLAHPRYYEWTKAEVDAIAPDVATPVFVNGDDWRTLAKRLAGGEYGHNCWVRLYGGNQRDGCVVLRYRNALIGVVSPSRSGSKTVNRLMALRDDGRAHFMDLYEGDAITPTNIVPIDNYVQFIGVAEGKGAGAGNLVSSVSYRELQSLVDYSDDYYPVPKPSGDFQSPRKRTVIGDGVEVIKDIGRGAKDLGEDIGEGVEDALEALDPF